MFETVYDAVNYDDEMLWLKVGEKETGSVPMSEYYPCLLSLMFHASE